MKRLISFLIISFLLIGCTTNISDIKKNPEKYVGKRVTVSGTAKNVIKLGTISGFSLEQDGERIPVGSKRLPLENTKVVVKGTVVKDTFLGYYIMAENIEEIQ